MKSTISHKGQACIIAIDGNLTNEYSETTIIDQIQKELESGIQFFILDLSNVSIVNSSGLNLLLSTLTIIRQNQAYLILSNISQQLSKLMIMTKLNSMFDIASSNEDAILKLEQAVK